MSKRTFFLQDPPSISFASKDYIDFLELLKSIDLLLEKTEAEKKLIDLALQKANLDNKMKRGRKARFRDYASFAIRCNLLRRFLKLDYRAFSVQASDSIIIQWFLQRGRIEGFTETHSGKGLSKSSLERYDKIVTATDIENIIHHVCASVSDKGWAGKIPGWNDSLSVSDIFVDCTCLESNIHFPVDWILLRDAVRTLSRSIDTIRQHGLKHRIKDPVIFISEINKLCMEMSAVTRSKKDSKKKRKQVLRKMKAVVKCVESHASRYYNLLTNQRTSRTDFTEAQAAQVLSRINMVLTQLPAAIKQAEDRIIREQKVADADKILNFYESDIHTIFRGKAGAAIEFGNTLFIAESRNGLIIDFKLFKDRAPSDSKMIKDFIDRCTAAYGRIDSITADRGFHSPENIKLLAEKEITNNILNKSPSFMAESFKDPAFKAAHKRRAQTEGRIGILKNVFIGECLFGKGFEHQEIEVGWSILIHNFWVLGRLLYTKTHEKPSCDKLKKSA